MIILDTNVISEPMKTRPNQAVLDWLDAQSVESLFITSISLAELYVGLEMLPDGKRKSGLIQHLNGLIAQLFSGRILSFDHAAAINYATLMSRAGQAGYVLSMGDGQIAAIAETHQFVVASRDTKPFIAAGVQVINPWELPTG